MNGEGSVCQEMDKFNNQMSERISEVNTRIGGLNEKIKEVDKKTIDVNDIPFIKRWPYRCEKEFRI